MLNNFFFFCLNAGDPHFKILKHDFKLFRIATNVIKFLGMSRRRSTHPGLLCSNLGKGNQEEQELQRRLRALRIPVKDILGKNYKPRKRHKTPPTNIKQKMIQNQCVAYASLPYSELRKIPEIPVPAVLAKRQLERPVNALKQESLRSKGHRNWREGSVFQSSVFARRQSMRR